MTHFKLANTHLVSVLVSGGKSKKMITFSDRLVVLHPLQSRMDEITEEIGLN